MKKTTIDQLRRILPENVKVDKSPDFPSRFYLFSRNGSEIATAIDWSAEYVANEIRKTGIVPEWVKRLSHEVCES